MKTNTILFVGALLGIGLFMTARSIKRRKQAELAESKAAALQAEVDRLKAEAAQVEPDKDDPFYEPTDEESAQEMIDIVKRSMNSFGLF